MLVVSEIDGLTQGEKVYRKGMTFVLDESAAKEARTLTESVLEARQKRIYGKRIYRRALPEDVVHAFKLKLIKIEDMEKEEKKAVVDYVRGDAQQKLDASKALEGISDMDTPIIKKREKIAEPEVEEIV
jgi:hypothetical protein